MIATDEAKERAKSIAMALRCQHVRQVLVWDSRPMVETFQFKRYIPISIYLTLVPFGECTRYTGSCVSSFFKLVNVQ